MLTILANSWHYRPWSGAINTYNELNKRGLLDVFFEAIEDYYPEGIDMTSLNDILWFKPEFCYELVGLKYDSENGEILD